MKVVVIGGGIGGLALAVTLGRNGIDCEVHERRADIVLAGSGLVLHPNGLAALERIDRQLYAEVRAVGYALPDGTPTFFLDGHGRVISRRVLPPRLRPVTIRRADLHRLLHSRARGANVVCHSNFLRYTMDGDRFSAQLASGRYDDETVSSETVTGDVLVGADGLNSRVRSQVLGDGDPVPMGLTSVKCIAKISHDDPHLRGGFVLFGMGRQAFCAPIGPDAVYWDVTVRARAGRWPGDPEDLQRDLLSSRWAWPAFVQDMIAAAEPEEMIVTDLRDRPGATRWSAGPVTLLGDAAHPMSPFLGQGTNQALLDAVVLAGVLRTHGEDLARAFRFYEAARLAEANQAMLDSRKIGFDGQTRNPFVRWKRDRTVRRAAI